MKKILSIGPLFIVVAAILWSFDGLLRRSLYVLPPTIIVFWEHILGALILSVFLVRSFPQIKKLSKKEWLALGAIGLFSGALGTILYTAALGKINFIQFSVVALLQLTQPIWTTIAAAVLLKEKVTKNFLGWAALALVASYFVTFKDGTINLGTGAGTALAGLIALLAAAGWGTSTAFSKILLNKVSFGVGTLLRFWVAAGFALLFVVGFGQQSSLLALNSSQWTAVLAITFSTGMVALLIYYYGLKKTPARVSEICELAWPASAVFIDYFYFKQGLSITQLAGVAVLLYAIYRVSKFKK